MSLQEETQRLPCEDMDKHGEYHMTMEAKIEVLQLQAKECQGLPANHQKLGRDKEGGSPTAFRESYVPTNT